MVSSGGSEVGLELTGKDWKGTSWDYENVFHSSNLGIYNDQTHLTDHIRPEQFAVFNLQQKILLTDIWNNIEESQKQYVQQKKPDTKKVHLV